MNYYERHLGDYAKDAGHLTMLEHGAYTLLLDRYYTTEQGIPAEQAHRVCRARTEDERAAVDIVLAEFFVLEDGAWKHTRVEREITKMQAKVKAARENGKRGGRPKACKDEAASTPVASDQDTEQKPSGFPLGSIQGSQAKALQTPDTSITTQPLPFPSVRELLQGIVDRSTATSAAEFHAFVAGELRGIGWAVEEEVEVPDRGDGRCGRVDLLVTAPVRVAIELDRGSVRTKSVNKLQQIDALRIVVLRDKREHEDVHGLDAVICRRTSVEPSRGRVVLKAWAAATKAKGETLIPEDDPVFGYADKVGIPRDFLDLAWPAFRHRYTVQHPEKRYVDWRRVFRNCIEGNWLKLWYVGQDGEYRLTTTGIQAQRAMAEAA